MDCFKSFLCRPDPDAIVCSIKKRVKTKTFHRIISLLVEHCYRLCGTIHEKERERERERERRRDSHDDALL